MKTFLFILSALVMMYGPAEVSAQGGISASPAKLYFSGAEGQRVTETIDLFNPGNEKIVFRTSLKDWVRDSLGTKIYYEKSQLPSSNASWVSVSPPLVELAPGEHKQVAVTLAVPQGDVQSAVTNSMLFFTQVTPQRSARVAADGKQTALNIQLEVGVHIYHSPAGLSARNIEISDFKDAGKIQSGNEVVNRLQLVLKNDGDLAADALLNFEVTENSTGSELRYPAKAISMLPGASQIVYLDLPAKLKGRVLAVALLEINDQSGLKVAEKNIFVP
jgi:P pilus assembly chaperone PapD